MRAICTDVYDKDGNLFKIEAHDASGEFIIQFMWDPRDPQTSKKREEFRKFAYRILEQKDYKVN